MTTERDELIKLESIARAAQNDPYGVPASLWPNQIAMAVQAAGYRRPRTITTVAELDALGVGSAVRDKWGVVRMKRMADSLMGAGWTDAGRHPLSSAELADGNPMEVLHDGGAA